MTFRLAIIAAGAVDTAESAAELFAAMRNAPECEPKAAIAQVLGALDGSPVGHYLSRCRHTADGALLCADNPESGLLEALLILAKDHDLAVYDIDINRLYDHTGGVEVDGLLPGVRIPFLTRDLLTDLVVHPEWPNPEASYLILERADQDFIQVWRCFDGVYQFEYREDGPESHFVVHTDDAEVIIGTMWAWATGDESWRTAVDWQFVALDEEEHIDKSVQVRVDRGMPPA